MHKGFIKIAALLGALSVAAGAFGAHLLRTVLGPENLAVFETAVRYQFYHVFALLATGLLFAGFPSAIIKRAGYLFIAGIFLFSGSLYLLCFVKQFGWHLEWIGAVTPVGGISFIAGWILLFAGVIRRN